MSEHEINQMVATMQQFGGLVSWRTSEQGSKKPYEMNIALYDALKGTVEGEDKFNFKRFICAHAIMLSLEVIPGLYIHSLLATQNDYEKFNNTNHNRAINRHRWHLQKLTDLLNNHHCHHSKVLIALKRIIDIRKQQRAFHPNATQFVLQLGPELFGIWRQSMDRRQSIFCIYNITNRTQEIRLNELNLIDTEQWIDLQTDKKIEDITASLPLVPYQSMWLTNVSPLTGEAT